MISFFFFFDHLSQGSQTTILGPEVVLQYRFLSFLHSPSFSTVWTLLQNVLFNLWGFPLLYLTSMAKDVASVQLCTRCRNARDGDMTCHKVVVCASCFATELKRCPLAQA